MDTRFIKRSSRLLIAIMVFFYLPGFSNEEKMPKVSSRNPFFSPTELKFTPQSITGQDTATEEFPLILEATFISDRANKAVVSGHIVEEGQRISNKTVLSIARDSVILVDRDQSFTLRLQKLFEENQ